MVFYYDATYTFKGFINDYYRQVLCSYEMQKTNLNGQESYIVKHQQWQLSHIWRCFDVHAFSETF
ncbi:hypothetical protein QW060_17985 [Myroides ceti]|uniref:Uncharacterized protein n=1 Tax=Paenimyroides ceti TaxID=395087 RepID=A0ABT8D0Z1_9FLAO|nr:hypothetical protein [Paenimyroides ceti]MDN3708967.1 hypothetical protein [Paenimyroides ceti]